MRLKPFLGMTLVALFACAVTQVFAQTAPAASESNFPLAVGGGLSSYNPDWAYGRMLGVAGWVDYTPNHVPSFLRGFGIEAEARDLNFGRASHIPKPLVEKTAGGGLIYTSRRYRNFHPYGKFLESYGSITWDNAPAKYRHDTRTVTSAGGGFEVHAYRRVWVRADYEYQFWPHLLGKTLDPSGFTLGATYHFGRPGGARYSAAY
jgi:hypothetical protein